MGIDYFTSNLGTNNNKGVIKVDNSSGDLFIRNIIGEKINNVSFSIPVEHIEGIEGGLNDSLGISLKFSASLLGDSYINIESNENRSLDKRNIYIGKILKSQLSSCGWINQFILTTSNNKVCHYVCTIRSSFIFSIKKSR